MSQQHPDLRKHARSSPSPPSHPNKKPTEGPSDGGELRSSRGTVKDPILPNAPAVVILDGELGELRVPKELFWEYGNTVKPGDRVLVWFFWRQKAPSAPTSVFHLDENGTIIVHH